MKGVDGHHATPAPRADLTGAASAAGPTACAWLLARARASSWWLLVLAVARFLVTGHAARRHRNFLTSPSGTSRTRRTCGSASPRCFGTVITSVVALVIAVPVAIGIALFISHYAPRRVATPLGYVVDLLAAMPVGRFGLWGAAGLMAHVQPL